MVFYRRCEMGWFCSKSKSRFSQIAKSLAEGFSIDKLIYALQKALKEMPLDAKDFEALEDAIFFLNHLHNEAALALLRVDLRTNSTYYARLNNCYAVVSQLFQKTKVREKRLREAISFAEELGQRALEKTQEALNS